VYRLAATEDVSATSAKRIGREYSGVVPAGRHDGHFTPDQKPDVIADIKTARPDILFVVMSAPKKDVFTGQWTSKMNIRVWHSVGGAFDVMAGKVKRAPVLWQWCGMEWLYRIVQEPRRMWRRRLVTDTLFYGMLLSELLRGR